MKNILISKHQSALDRYKENKDLKINEVGYTGETQRNKLSYFVYPQNLENADELPHAVYFYINVRGKTKYKKAYDINASQLNNQLTSVGGSGSLTPEQLNKTARAQATTLLATAAGTATTSLAQGGVLGLAAGVAAAGATGIFGEAIINSVNNVLKGVVGDALTNDESLRITDVIALPLETKPTVKYEAGYRSADMGFFAAFAENLQSLGGNQVNDATKTLATRILAQVAQAPEVLGIPNPVQTQLRAGASAINPYREVFFESVKFRVFNFNYTFLPRNNDEINIVKDIIDLFKFHMHPEYISQNNNSTNFLLYPSFFNIEYQFKQKENRFINKIGKCVLRDMSVNYGGDYFTSFENGAPAEIYLRLTFEETELLTKEKILEGY